MKNFILSLFVSFISAGASLAQKPGDLDSSFGANGKVTTRYKNVSGRAIAIQDDGRIVVAAGYSQGFVTVRYLQDGTLDRSFGKHGIVETDFHNRTYSAPKSILIQKDGRIIVGGYADEDFALVRYKLNGQLDSSFGIKGKSLTQSSSFLGGCESLAIEPDGKIVATGTGRINSQFVFCLLRYRQNGILDSSFGENGIVSTYFGAISNAHSVTVQPDGKLLEAGSIYRFDSGYAVALARFHHDGRPDSSFGINGKLITDLGFSAGAISIAKLKSGKILVAAGDVNVGKFILLQYRSNGELDSNFGDHGKVFTYFDGFVWGARSLFAIPENGKILAGGLAGDARDFALAEYRHDGTIEQTFGTNGKVTTDFGSADGATAGAIQNDGKIVVVGYSIQQVALARYYGHNILFDKSSDADISDLRRQRNTSSTIHLSPNPVKNILHIEGLSSSAKTISIIDIKGKLLQTTVTANSSYSFNVKQLSAGIYFIKIDEGGIATTLKFIKE